MASKEDLNDDEYVAKLLAEDAKKSSIKYSSLGLSALLPTRPTNAAPKPNTRFLKSIIRETDTHNAALKKKEELEARIRLRKMREDGPRHQSSRGYEERRDAKRRRLDEEGYGRLRNSSSERSESRERVTKPHRNSDNRRKADASSEYDRYRVRKDRHQRRKSRSRIREDSRDGSSPAVERSHRRHYKRRRRSESASSHYEGGDKEKSQTARKDRMRTSRRRNSSSRSRLRNDQRHSVFNKQLNGGSTIIAAAEPASRSSSRSSSSDPLEALVGPLPSGDIVNRSPNDPPPQRSRGRGAYRAGGAAMDAHFCSNYDPKLDLHPESEVEDEKEDWDMALEALRDREMWKQKQAERLREAGFGDEEIKKWEDAGKEKYIQDVKWSGKGEAREWDIGKLSQDEPEEKPVGKVFEEGWKRKGGAFLKSFKEALR